MKHEMSHKAVIFGMEFDMEAGDKLLNQAAKSRQLYFNSVSKDSKSPRLFKLHLLKPISEVELRDLNDGYIKIWDQGKGEIVLDWNEAADLAIVGDFAARKWRNCHNSIVYFLFYGETFLGSLIVYKDLPGYMSADRVPVGSGAGVDRAICTYAVRHFRARQGHRCSFGIPVYDASRNSASAQQLADRIRKELPQLSVEMVERDGSPLVLLNQNENG